MVENGTRMRMERCKFKEFVYFFGSLHNFVHRAVSQSVPIVDLRVCHGGKLKLTTHWNQDLDFGVEVIFGQESVAGREDATHVSCGRVHRRSSKRRLTLSTTRRRNWVHFSPQSCGLHSVARHTQSRRSRT
eukprot:562636-Prymnesium_polylepis.1